MKVRQNVVDVAVDDVQAVLDGGVEGVMEVVGVDGLGE